MKKSLLYLVLLVISATSFAQLSGTYTVGPTGNFPTPNEAIQALNAQGISGSVTFSIAPGTYEVLSSINQFSGSSFNDTVVFTSSTNNADDVILEHTYSSANPYLIQLDSAEHIIFKNLSFHPVNYRRAIEIIHVVDLRIRNCKFYSTWQSANLRGFIEKMSDGEDVSDSIIIIQNNYFEKGDIGIYLHSYVTSSGVFYDVNISNNTFSEQGYEGCDISKIYNYLIFKNNDIHSSYDDVAFGVYIDRSNNDSTYITNNKINIKSNYDTTTYNYTTGLKIGNSDLNNNPQIYNNLIYVNNPNGMAYGLSVVNGVNCNAQFNTVVVNGISETAAFYFRFAAPSFVIQNNNFISFGSGYVFRTYDTHDPTSEISVFDYNNCYTDGAFFCRWAGTEMSLQDFRTATSYAFLNHISQIASSFAITDNNYAISCNDLSGTGTYVNTVSVDYNTVTRPNPPSVGAIEYQDTSFNLIDASWTNSCGSSNNQINITEITDPSFSNQWLFNTDTIAVDSTNWTYLVSTSGWLKLELKRNNCILNDSLYLSIDTMPVVNLGNDTTLCETNQLSLVVTSGYSSYAWSTNDTTNSIITDASSLGIGTSNIYVSVTNGSCLAQDSIQITFDEMPSVNLGNDTTLCEDASYTLNASSGFDYVWSTGETSESITVDTTSLGTGSHIIYVTVTNGTCQTVDSVNITFNVCSGIEALNISKINIYPNPAHNQLIISNNQSSINKIQIFDITGKVVFTVIANEVKQSVNIENLKNGIYFIKIQLQDKVETIKFIKE